MWIVPLQGFADDPANHPIPRGIWISNGERVLNDKRTGAMLRFRPCANPFTGLLFPALVIGKFAPRPCPTQHQADGTVLKSVGRSNWEDEMTAK
jgi:hypothetical protein